MKLIINIIIAISIFFSAGVYSAEDTAVGEKIDHIVVEEDLANKFIYATFGKDALIWFESRDINDPSNLKIESQPFNSKVMIPLSFIFVVIVFFTIVLFLIYFTWITYNGLFKTQNSGEFLGKNWNKVFFAVKLLMSTTLIFPMSFIDSKGDSSDLNVLFNQILPFEITSNNLPKFNLIQLLTFSVAGQSNNFGRLINEVIIDNQPKLYPSLKIPDNDTKIFDMKNLVEYFICVKTNNDINGQINMNFIRDKGNITGSSSIKGCKLKISFAIDSKITSAIKKDSSFLSPLIGNYEDVQLDIISTALLNLFNKADHVSDILLVDEPFVKNRESVFADQTKMYSENIDNINYWEDNCDDIFNYQHSPSDKTFLKVEKEQYAYLAYRCLSYELNKSIILNDNISGRYLKDKNYLSGNYIQLCTHEYTDSDSMKIVKSTEKTDETINLEDTSTVVMNTNFLSIKECVTNSCSKLSSNVSNLYSCANSLHLYLSLAEDEKIKKYGFFALGSYIYKQFSNFSADDAKSIYNNFKVTNNASSNSSLTGNDSNEIKLLLINKIQNIEINKRVVSQINNINISDIDSKLFSPNESDESSSFLNKVFDDDFLGMKRLSTCVKQPMRVSSGYSCGSVTEEYHNFGDNLFNTIAKVKIAFIVMDSLRVTKTKKGERKKKKANISGKKMTNIKSTALMIGKTIPVIAGASAIKFLDTLDEQSLKTDEFGSITSKDITYWSYADEMLIIGAGIMAYMGNAGVFDGLNMMVSTLFIISIIFKYVIPFMPYYFFLTLIFGWVLLLFEMIIITPIWAVSILKPSMDHTNEVLKKGLNLYIALFLKTPFLILGTIIAWIMTNTVSSRIFTLFEFGNIVKVEYGQSISGIMDATVMAIVYMIVLFTITNITLSIMLNFYDFATKWITDGTTSVNQGNSGNNTNSAIGQTAGEMRNFLK